MPHAHLYRSPAAIQPGGFAPNVTAVCATCGAEKPLRNALTPEEEGVTHVAHSTKVPLDQLAEYRQVRQAEEMEQRRPRSGRWATERGRA